MTAPRYSSSRSDLSDKHLVLLFHTTHETMHAESILKDHRMRFKLIPRPREIQDDCGLGLVILKNDRSKAEGLISSRDVHIKAAFYIEKGGQWTRENYPPAPIS